jgi:heptosyltransferase-2
LVVKLADIGDVLTATPALRALRLRYPAAQLDVLTTPHAAAILPASLADHVLIAPRNLLSSPGGGPALGRLLAQLRRNRYDAVAFLHHLTLRSGVAKYRLLAAATQAPVLAGLDNGHGGWLTHPAPDAGFGAFHEVEYALHVVERLGAAAPADTRLLAELAAADLAAAAGWLRGMAGRPRVAIHPGSGGYSLARRWGPECWAAVADDLARNNDAGVVLVGAPADGTGAVAAAMATPALDLAGLTSLPQLAALLSQCDLFLGADSGIMHLAAAVGVPVVALFGPSNHLAWGPWAPGGQARIVRLGLNCSPCSYVGHSVGWRDGCWHRSCLADLPPAQVLAAIAALGVLRTVNRKQPSRRNG